MEYKICNLENDYVFISECRMYKSLTDSTRKVNVRADLSTKKADRSGNSYTSVD